MDKEEWMTDRFEVDRARLHAVAYRMLGSLTEAEDAVQEAWIRFCRSDTDAVENLSGWLTTVVARVCLDMLRSRKSRRETTLDEDTPEAVSSLETWTNPEQELLLADSMGPALLLVLDTLTPPERVAFVLHDMFAISFEEIANILGRSPAASRQLASRARRRIQGKATADEADRARQKKIVQAFLIASRMGDFGALLNVLDPDVVLRADEAAVRMGSGRVGLTSETHGAEAVADFFKGKARAARLATIDGIAGAAWASGGNVRAVFEFTFENDMIIQIDIIMESSHLDRLDVEIHSG